MAAFSITKNIDTYIAAIAGFAIILLLTQHGGVGISPDSIYYASTARNINAGNGFMQYGNKPLIIFPNGYPSFLSIAMWLTRKDIIVIAPSINAFLFAITIFLCGHIMNDFLIKSIIYKRILLFCITISPALTDVFSMLWSETLFIVWILFFIIFLRKYLLTKTTTALFLLACITALACVTRYAGVTVAATGGLFLLLQRNISTSKKIVHLIIFSLLGSSLLAINLMHNHQVSGTFTGIRQLGVTGLSENIKHFGEVLCNWLPLPKEHAILSIFIALVFFIVIAVGCIYRFISYKNFNTYENIAACFFTIYVFFIVVSATISRYETLNNRFFSPIFICWLWSATFFILGWLQVIANNRKRWIGIIVVSIAAIAFQANQYLQLKDLYSEYKDEGIGGYAEDLWQQSATMQFLKKYPNYFKKNTAIYCNANEAVYFFTGMTVTALPERVHTNFVNEFYKQNKQYIIWLTETGNPDLLNMDEIAQHKKIVMLQKLKDGIIYYCTNK